MWQKWTYEEYYRDIRAAAKSFVHLGLQKYNAVAIFGFNSPEWYISNFGSMFAGGVSLGIYTTSSPEAIKYILEDSNTAIAVVENTASLKRVLKAAEGSLRIKAIIQYTGEIEEQQPNIYTWKDFIKLGKDMSDEELDSRTADITPNKCCSLIYTSGTTGNPKGAMLSHDNLVWTAHVTWDRLYSELPPTGPERFVSYLPLSHIAAQLVEVYMPTTVHGSVYFARPDALKGTLVDTLKDVRPTFMMGVPRVWEKIAEKLQALARQNHGLKKKIGNWAKGVGLRGNLSVNEGGSVPFGWGIAKALVFKKIKVGLGLDKCKRRYVGAAPISKDAMKYYMSIDLSLQEVFGLTESSGPFTLSPVGGIKLGSCGIAIGGLDSKIDQPDEDGVGELCGFGRNVFMGYLNNEAKTNEAIDENGWLHTGDLAKQDKNGYVYITGRQKEIIITSGGENVAPVPIEEDIKKELPMLSSVMLVGDQRKYLTCLVAFKVEVDPNTTAPTNKLTPEAVEICHKLGVEVRTVEEVIEDKTDTIKKAIQAGLDRVNERSKSRAQKVQKAHIIEKDFSVPGGELGPTLKLKRPVVLKLYADVIDKVYAEE
ncbi:uncharacterized protein TRIADDRAFT_49993 [Trichoplax adhaerens]|uniref:long-chain-fatty-acid--CoA ligase n=1 Tax=Trichoplax adhaerens TaxID=10228 RepID=B3RRR3_TRIAD|nr:hypothetical protein TRIADDRAFT_49993 [Trichoplax adhaerens]EDV26395.1 hypothetical protein TRIADDRAFT_49993 [Trichoplax adhaerens]|eukprot:XP_002110391.1 hypothetical protein TRIADDRAFT_49993 [Trichoplax adhaerens]